MARIARVVLPGYPHHATQRGNRRQRVFFRNDDYAHYLELIRQGCLSAQTECLAYCLMPNHVHMVLTPNAERGLALPWRRRIAITPGPVSISGMAGGATSGRNDFTLFP